MEPGLQLATLLIALPFATAITVTVPVFREVAGLFSGVMIALQIAVLGYAFRALEGTTANLPEPLANPTLDTEVPWIDIWGIGYHVVLDYPALGLCALTLAITGAATMYSWFVGRERLYLIHSMFWISAGALNGVFMARDLVLWYIFFELMLIPMVFMIGIWGGADRIKAALTMMIYTLVGSLLMLVGLMGIGTTAGTFDMFKIAAQVSSDPSLLPTWAFWFVLAAMAVKAPLIPLHGWLPLAYREAPVEGAAVLSGLISKAAMVGVILILVPIYPQEIARVDTWLVVVAIASILYGSISAFRQETLRGVIAYSSIAQMGLVLLGVFVALSDGGEAGLAGAYLQTINHGLVSGALFLLAGIIEMRTGTGKLAAMKGIAQGRPRFATLGIVLVLIALAVPGSSVFASELMVLLGAWEFSPWAASIAGLAIVLAAMYALRMGSAVLHTDDDASTATTQDFADIAPRELAIIAPLVVLLLVLSVKPAILKQPMNERMIEYAAGATAPIDVVVDGEGGQ